MKPHQVRVWWDLPDEPLLISKAVHEAAHAVVGVALGLQLTRLWVAADREIVGEAGEAQLSGTADAQVWALWLLAGPAAQVRWLAGEGYTHTALANNIATVMGQGDEAVIAGYREGGFTIGVGEAQHDVARILDNREVWAAVLRVADRLVTRGELLPADAVGAMGRLPTVTVWLPHS